MRYDQTTPPSLKADRGSLDDALTQVDRLLGPRAERLDWRAEANLRLVRACLWRLQDVTGAEAGASATEEARP
jgi:hypothetical protein